MANAQPAPPPDLRPMRPIQRVPFVEEVLPLVGPALADPNDHPLASTPPAAASAAASTPAAATPSFVTSAAPLLTAPAGSVPSFASTLATAAPSAAALASLPSFATAVGVAAPALNAVAPALGAAGSVVSKIASEVPAAEALLASPSAATALGAAAPALSAIAPNVAQYANPLLQNVAYQDPTLTNADRVAGIGQSHPTEDAQVSGMLQNMAVDTGLKQVLSRSINMATIGTFLGPVAAPIAVGVGAVVNALKIKPAY